MQGVTTDSHMTTVTLSQRTWFQLRTTAHAHCLRFNTHWTLEQARECVYAHLMRRGKLNTTWQILTLPEQRALQTLQAAGGMLPRHCFTRDFGFIRPCTQRRPHNWRVWLSPAEHLWLLGFIELSRDGRHILLTQEAAALLPPLPHPQRSLAQPLSDFRFTRAALCVDMAAFLGTLLREDFAPLYGRWLSLNKLREHL